MDYAYQMMNHFWSPYTLNNRELVTKTDLYDTITLKKIEGVNTLSDQYNGYSFLGNFDFANKVDAKENYDIVYDLTNRTIKNADALTGENHQQDGLFPLDAPYYTGGEVTTGKIQNTSNQELLQDHNYHYAIKSNGKFVYNESSNLYFTFTGDDDVYLYINNHLVMDIGGAHRAYTETVNINEIAEACGLKDGNVYDFDFFYLERHIDYANLKINTNIEVVEPEATVSKTAYESNGKEIPDGTSVPKGTEVTYAITFNNTGSSPLHDLHISDPLLGVELGRVKNEDGTQTHKWLINQKEITDADAQALSYTIVRVDPATDIETVLVAEKKFTGLAELQQVILATEQEYTSGSRLTIKGFKKRIDTKTTNIVLADAVGLEDYKEVDVDAGEDKHVIDIDGSKEFFIWDKHPDSKNVLDIEEKNKITDGGEIHFIIKMVMERFQHQKSVIMKQQKKLKFPRKLIRILRFIKRIQIIRVTQMIQIHPIHLRISVIRLQRRKKTMRNHLLN